MNWHVVYAPIISLLVAIAYFAVHLALTYSKLRKYANGAIVDAEQLEVEGKQKMMDAVDQLYALVPPHLRLFITRTMIQNLVQRMFDKVEAYAKTQLAKKQVSDGDQK